MKTHAGSIWSIVALASVVLADPVIVSVSPPAPARSGRMVLQGTGFGTMQGSDAVLVDGAAAFVASWTDTRVVAYVPEATRLGPVPVQVVAGGVPSNAVPVTVGLRAGDGRVQWRFQGDGLYTVTRPAVDAAGRIYVVDVHGTLYALAPDGALRWLVRGAGGKGVDVGADGVVYTGSEDAIRAFQPDGTPLWTFVQNPRAFILLGPNVGPDGNVYAVATSGMGLLSLDPSGQLRWAVPEPYRRGIVDYQEVVFGQNGGEGQLYFHANDHFLGVRTRDGNTVFAITGGRSQPAVGADQSIYVGSLGRWDPSGNLLGSLLGMSQADCGADGRVYGSLNVMAVTARNADLSQVWTTPTGGMVNYPMIDPRSRVLVSGGALNYGMSGYLQGHDAAGGALLWQVQLPSDLGNNLTIAGRSRFARSGHTVYAPVMMFGYNESDFYWYLYALRTDDAWEDLGHALAGPAGVPVLRGDGPLTGGSPLTVTLTGARPARPGVLFVGFAALNAPLLGGVLVPRPDVPLFWTTDGAGAASFRVTWPAGVPAGFSIWYQAWTADPGAPQGVSASNALRSVSQ